MKTKLHSLFIGLAFLAGVHEAAGLAATNTPAAIPWNQIGAKAGADYQGDGLAVPGGGGWRLIPCPVSTNISGLPSPSRSPTAGLTGTPFSFVCQSTLPVNAANAHTVPVSSV
jgi:hypothetical protein